MKNYSKQVDGVSNPTWLYDSGTLSVVSDTGPDISTVVGLEDIQKAFVQLQKQEVRPPLKVEANWVILYFLPVNKMYQWIDWKIDSKLYIFRQVIRSSRKQWNFRIYFHNKY